MTYQPADRSREVIVIGAGGHARVIVSTLRANGRTVQGVLDDNPRLWGENLLDLKIEGPVERINEMPQCDAIVGVGNAVIRKQLVERINTKWTTAVHPQAYVDPTATLGPGTVVFAGAIVQPESELGAHCIVNTGGTVDHNCTLEDYVQVAPGANLSGRVHVCEGTFVGVGSAVLETLTLGAWSIVGGGAVVIRNLPDRVVAVGCPAHVIRQIRLDVAASPIRTTKVRSAVTNVLQRVLSDSGRSLGSVTDTDNLSEALDLDSLDLAVTVVGLEKELGVDPFRSGARPVRTLGELVQAYEEAVSPER